MGKQPKKAEPAGKAASSIRQRVLDFFLENIGKVVTGDQIEEAARDPKTKKIPKRWHQRISELRTDFGYNIETHNSNHTLKVSEYRLTSAIPNPVAGKRRKIHHAAWEKVLERAGHACEWEESGRRCGLKEGEIDPEVGVPVRLTPDHKTPHSVASAIDPDNPDEWQVLCSRHQVMKKNFWDHKTGKLNVYAIILAAPKEVKREVYEVLKKFFGD